MSTQTTNQTTDQPTLGSGRASTPPRAGHGRPVPQPKYPPAASAPPLPPAPPQSPALTASLADRLAESRKRKVAEAEEVYARHVRAMAAGISEPSDQNLDALGDAMRLLDLSDDAPDAHAQILREIEDCKKNSDRFESARTATASAFEALKNLEAQYNTLEKAVEAARFKLQTAQSEEHELHQGERRAMILRGKLPAFLK